MDGPTIYRKTALGQAEISERRAPLTPRARNTLIMINGRASRGQLVQGLGPSVEPVLDELLGLGLIEPVPEAPSRGSRSSGAGSGSISTNSKPATSPAPAPAPSLAGLARQWAQGLGGARTAALATTTPSPQATQATPHPTEPGPPSTLGSAPSTLLGDTQFAPELRELKRRAWALLAPHFGPDVRVICAPVLAARDDAEFMAALTDVEERLAIYLGRRGAAHALAPLRQRGG